MQTYEVSRAAGARALRCIAGARAAQQPAARRYGGGQMDVAQLLAMWELLAELEGIGAQLACERMTPAEREELAAIHERAGAVARREDAEAWQDHNRRFHDALYQGARNLSAPGDPAHALAHRRLPPPRLFGLAATWLPRGRSTANWSPRSRPGRGPAAGALMTRHMSPGQGSISFASFIAALPSCWPEAGGRGTDRRRIRPPRVRLRVRS